MKDTNLHGLKKRIDTDSRYLWLILVLLLAVLFCLSHQPIFAQVENLPQRFFYEDYEDANGDEWTTCDMEITTLNPRIGGGTYSSRTNYYQTGGFTGQAKSDLENFYDKELYIKFYFFHDLDFNVNNDGASVKLLRLQHGTLGDRTMAEAYLYGDMKTLVVFSFQVGGRLFREEFLPVRPDGQPLEKGKWHKFEMYLKYNDQGVYYGPALRGDKSNGILKVWIDDYKVTDYTDWEWIGDNLSIDENKYTKISCPSNVGNYNFADDENHYQVDDVEMWNGLPSSQRFFYEDYEDGNGDEWNTPNAMEITTLNPRPGGNYSARTNFASENGYTSQIYSKMWDKYDKELFLCFYVYFDNDFDLAGVGGNFKVIRLRGRGFANVPFYVPGARTSTEMHFGPGGGGLNFIRVVSYNLDTPGGRAEDHYIYDDKHSLEKGKWYKLEIYMKFNDPAARAGCAPWGCSHGYASNGILRIWFDGRKVVDWDDWEYFPPNNLSIEENRYYRLSTPSNCSDAHFEDTVNHYQTDDWEMWNGMPPANLPGDVNQDGKVDIKDLILVAKDFGKTSGFNLGCDVNKDNKVDIKDLIIVAKNFGKRV